MQNFKGFQNLDKLVWDRMTSRGHGQNTSSRMKTPPSLARYRSTTKNHLHNYSHRPFCRELFSASFETFSGARRCSETEKISKYHQKLKKSFFCIFMVYPQKFEDCEIRQDQQVSQKNVIFWIY